MRARKFISHPNRVIVPTLLVGIGGIGGRIVSAVNDELSEFDKKYIRMIVLDTNQQDIDKLKEKGISCIQTSAKMTVQDYLDQNPEFLEWFPVNQLINGKNLTDGAGQIRSVSRLGALASEENLSKIGASIDEVSFNYGDSSDKAVKIMVVGSISGGTGSGIGIQLPFYIRKLVKEANNMTDVLIRGLFLTPSVVTGVQQTESSKKAMYVNGYAFVRELNAFYRAQLLPDEDIKIDIEYYEKGKHNEGKRKELQTANQVPYNFMFFLEKKDIRGRNIGGLKAYEEKAARIVKSQLFSSASTSQYSAEDNLIISCVENNGMDRYCGAGVASAIYPYAENLRYCTLNYCNDSISDFWLTFDEAYARNQEIQRHEMLTNQTLHPVTLAEFYKSEFAKKTGDISAASHNMARLRQELHETIKIQAPDGTEEVRDVDAVEKYITNIINYVEDTKAQLGLEHLRRKCEITQDDLDYDEASGNISAILNAMSEYRSETVKLVNKMSVACAGDIFPISLEAARDKLQSADCSLYRLFVNKHPLTSRYILYRLRDELEERRSEAESISSNIALDIISKTDFDTSDKVRQSPNEALARYSLKGIMRGIHDISGITVTSKEYKTVQKLIESKFNEELANIDCYRDNKFLANVFKIVIDRIDMLIDLYEKFFTSLKSIHAHNKEEVEAMEGVSVYRNGNLMICADGDCKKALNNEIKFIMTGDEISFEPEIKKAFVDEIYKIFAIEIRKANGELTDEVTDIKAVFEKGVFAPMYDFVEERAGGHIDLGIMGAIEKEYSIKKAIDNYKGGEKYSEINNAKEYTKNILTIISELASPLILYKGAKNSCIASSWRINKNVALHYQGNVSSDVDEDALAKIFNVSPTDKECMLQIDNTFDGDELICYKSVYGLSVENISSFEKGGLYETKYNERMYNIINGMYELEIDRDGYLNSVHPHLDKKWYNQGYLPLLHTDADKKELNNCKTAFLLGMALGVFSFAEDEDFGECWSYLGKNYNYAKAILVDGKKVSRPYHQLCKAMEYNEVIKNEILSEAKKYQNAGYKKDDLRGVTNESVVTDIHKVIYGLINNNILDVIIITYLRTRDIVFCEELILCLINYIREYCMAMVNEKRFMAQKMTQHIINEITKASKELPEAPDKFVDMWNKMTNCLYENEEE